MATASKSYSFVSGDYARSAEVNQNFDDIITFLNGSVMHKDGTVAFTGAPSYAADPASNNVLTRKSYVVTNAITPLLARPKLVGVGTGVSASPPAVASNQYQIQAGHTTVFLDGSKRATVTMPIAFPNGLLTVVAVDGSEAELLATGYIVDGYTTSSFRVTLPMAGVTTHKVNWIAVGW